MTWKQDGPPSFEDLVIRVLRFTEANTAKQRDHDHAWKTGGRPDWHLEMEAKEAREDAERGFNDYIDDRIDDMLRTWAVQNHWIYP